MNMKRNKKIIGISCFVLLLLVGIIYGYMHSINIYRLEVTQIEGSGYGYKIYEREFDNRSAFYPGCIREKTFSIGARCPMYRKFSAGTN